LQASVDVACGHERPRDDQLCAAALLRRSARNHGFRERLLGSENLSSFVLA
jgi:hypothetical protein